MAATKEAKRNQYRFGFRKPVNIGRVPEYLAGSDKRVNWS